MSDDEEGGAKAQNTANGEQSGYPVFVLDAEGQVLQCKNRLAVISSIFYKDYGQVQIHKLCNHGATHPFAAYLAGNTPMSSAVTHHRLRKVTCNNTAATQHFNNFI